MHIGFESSRCIDTKMVFSRIAELDDEPCYAANNHGVGSKQVDVFFASCAFGETQLAI